MVSGRLESPPLKPVDGVGILVYFSILRHAIVVDDEGSFALSRFIASPKYSSRFLESPSDIPADGMPAIKTGVGNVFQIFISGTFRD